MFLEPNIKYLARKLYVGLEYIINNKKNKEVCTLSIMLAFNIK